MAIQTQWTIYSKGPEWLKSLSDEKLDWFVFFVVISCAFTSADEWKLSKSDLYDNIELAMSNEAAEEEYEEEVWKKA